MDTEAFGLVALIPERDHGPFPPLAQGEFTPT